MSYRCAVRFFGRLHKKLAGILAYVKRFLCDMTENLQADVRQRRQPLIVRCCLNLIFSLSAIIWCIGAAAGIIICAVLRIIKIFRYKTFTPGSAKAIPFMLMVGFFILWFGIMFLTDNDMFEMLADSIRKIFTP